MDILIPFKKVWNFADGGFGEMVYHLNPNSMSLEGIEFCKVRDNTGSMLKCTKVFYSGRFIILLGTPDEFLKTCRDANVAYGLLNDLYKEGLTIEDFIKRNEQLNNVQLH